MPQTLAIGMPGPFEMVIIAGLALLIFGKRVPEVARNMGLAIKGFQQGLKSTGEEVATVEPKRLPADER